MPTVLQVRGYRFGFFSSDWHEPYHVHVTKGGCEAKFWLRPVRFVENYGFRAHELRTTFGILQEHEDEICRAWDEFFGETQG